MRIAFATPAYWPALAFGGPIPVFRALAKGLVERGHEVDVFTTSLVDLGIRPRLRSRISEVDGARVHYLGTPARYRWMGITPLVPFALERSEPDVLHVFGFRDFVGTAAAAWARVRRVPYVFEPLGMFAPKLRKMSLKRVLDATLYRRVATGAQVALATSEVERRELLLGGVRRERIVIRPNGFPAPIDGAAGALRGRLGIDADAPLLLSVGRVARGKGLELLVEALPELPGVHLAIVGPDGGHGLMRELTSLRDRLGVAERVHLLEPSGLLPPLELYADADIFVLASRHENFGMVAAEAAAAGTAIVITDRCGVADLLREGAACVVPYEPSAIREAIARLLGDAPLREQLGAAARDVARQLSWEAIVPRQEEIYQRLVR